MADTDTADAIESAAEAIEANAEAAEALAESIDDSTDDVVDTPTVIVESTPQDESVGYILERLGAVEAKVDSLIEAGAAVSNVAIAAAQVATEAASDAESAADKAEENAADSEVAAAVAGEFADPLEPEQVHNAIEDIVPEDVRPARQHWATRRRGVRF
jgi:hypothetical protein